MFRDVPEYSGMFHVPGFIDGRKKLVNVKQGTGRNDVVTKSQIQLLDSARPGYVTNNKAVIYSSTGA